MENNSQELPAMPQSPHIWALSSQDEMILSRSDTFLCTFWEESCPGKIWKHQAPNRNTSWSCRKRCRRLWISYVISIYLRCRCSLNMHEIWSFNRLQITCTWRKSYQMLGNAFKSASITNMTGRQANDVLFILLTLQILWILVQMFS